MTDTRSNYLNATESSHINTVRTDTGVAIRPVTDLNGFARCVELQLETWGYADSDTIPRRMFLVAQRAGGQVLGAYDTGADGGVGHHDNMIGFVLSIPGYRDGHSYLHSHMLAVLGYWRDRGIGQRLKLAQRDDALARGIGLIEWTFDPLEIKNAYLNIMKLGAIARRYVANLYGNSTSVLQGGLPSDRLYAEWWLRSPRVEAAVRGEAAQPLQVGKTVKVPGEIYSWRKSESGRERALDVQTANRFELQAAFADGLAVTAFSREADGSGSYGLSTWNEE